MEKCNAPDAKGWGKSPASRKWHYFNRDSFSLCGKIGFYFGPVSDNLHESPENCAECKKKFKKVKN